MYIHIHVHTVGNSIVGVSMSKSITNSHGVCGKNFKLGMNLVVCCFVHVNVATLTKAITGSGDGFAIQYIPELLVRLTADIIFSLH